MRRWFLAAVIVSLACGYGYLFLTSPLCAWINTTPSPDGCAELFYPWVHQVVAFGPGLLVLIAGLLVTRGRGRVWFASFAGFALLTFVGFIPLLLLLVSIQ